MKILISDHCIKDSITHDMCIDPFNLSYGTARSYAIYFNIWLDRLYELWGTDNVNAGYKLW